MKTRDVTQIIKQIRDQGDKLPIGLQTDNIEEKLTKSSELLTYNQLQVFLL